MRMVCRVFVIRLGLKQGNYVEVDLAKSLIEKSAARTLQAFASRAVKLYLD